MPSCETCDRYLSPATVRADGTCPTCGSAVTVGDTAAAASTSHPTGVGSDETGDETEKVPIPWHLKLAIAALTIYLGWRAWEGIAWLIERVSS